jgi:hypothetical protein
MLNDFRFAPVLRTGFIDAQHNVVMIAHDGISTDIDSKNIGKLLHPIDDPLAAVFVVTAAERIFAAQESTPYTARDAMIKRRVVETYFGFPGYCHGGVFI